MSNGRRGYALIMNEDGVTEYINLDQIVSATFGDYMIRGDATVRRSGVLVMAAGENVEIFDEAAARLEAMIRTEAFPLYDNDLAPS